MKYRKVKEFNQIKLLALKIFYRVSALRIWNSNRALLIPKFQSTNS